MQTAGYNGTRSVLQMIKFWNVIIYLCVLKKKIYFSNIFKDLKFIPVVQTHISVWSLGATFMYLTWIALGIDAKVVYMSSRIL